MIIEEISRTIEEYSGEGRRRLIGRSYDTFTGGYVRVDWLSKNSKKVILKRHFPGTSETKKLEMDVEEVLWNLNILN